MCQLPVRSVRSLYLFLAAGLVFAFSNSLAVPASAQSFDTTPVAYRAYLHALGRKNFQQADSLLQTLLQREIVYPEIFETGPLFFVYQNRFADGFAFFDSIRASGKHIGDALGAMAIIRHHERKNEESLNYLTQALAQNCRMLRPYELFVRKSFEVQRDSAALQKLEEFTAQHPENWRHGFALAQWYSSARQPKETCELGEQILIEGHRHWRLYFMLGSNLAYLGKHQEALARYKEGLQFCETSGDEEGGMRMWYGIAETQTTLGKIAEAKAALRRAESLAEQNGNELFAPRIASQASQFLINEQQWLAARDRLLLAREQAIRLAEGTTLLRIYYQLMNLNRVIGRWDEAVAHTLKIAAVADSIGLHAYYLDMLSIVAVIDIEAGRYEQALAYLQHLETNARQKNILLHRAPFLFSMAIVFVALERYDEAESAIREGAALAEESGNVSQFLDFQKYLCAVWLHTGRQKQAFSLLHTSIATAEKKDLYLRAIELKLLLAEAFLLENQNDAARQLVLKLLAKQPEKPTYKNHLSLLCLLAQSHLQEGDEARAVSVYAEAVALISAQTHMLNPAGLSSLSNEERTAYFGLSQAYLRSGEKLRALTATENAHDLVVRRKQLQARLLKNDTSDAELRNRLTQSDSLLNALRREQVPGLTPAEKMTLDGKIRGAEQQRAQLLERMLPANALTGIQSEKFPLEDFQQMLVGRNELAIKFFVGPKQTLVFFLDGTTLDAKEIAIGRNELQTLLTRIHTLLTPASSPQDSSYKAQLDQAAAHEMYRRLLADWLHGRNAAQLAIVPDDVLHALPFDLLVTSAPGLPPEFLLHRFAIRNGISLTSLLQAPQQQLKVRTVLMLADPNFTREEAPQSSGPRAGEIFLPVGRRELEVVREIIRIHKELTGQEANKAQLFAALQQSDWFHFASHSVNRARQPLFAEFILSILADGKEPERAHAFEIFQMQLPTKLAILSACETARGAFWNGEGFVGFVQAFRAAGTPSVIASLWKVENHASTQFFEYYYHELLRGKSTSAALQAAKLKMLDDPRYSVLDWAAFNYYGQDWNVELEKPVAKFGIAIMSAAIVFVVLAVRAYLRKRSRNA